MSTIQPLRNKASAPIVPSTLPVDVATLVPARDVSDSNCAPARKPGTDDLDRAAHAVVAAWTGGLSPASMMLAWLDWVMHLTVSPGKRLDLATEALVAPAAQAGGSPLSADPASPANPASQTKADPRFAAAEWEAWPFHLYRDAFLRAQQWWEHATSGVPGVEAHHEELVRFWARQWLDACSPGNFLATNPSAQKALMDSGGGTAVQGAKHWMEDFADMTKRLRGGHPDNPSAWRPGHEVACTPGRVIWRNELCELLQYEPATSQVAREPVLIVPSWIMKYYILDLQPRDSLVKYMVDEGYTVFMVSWRNPGAADRDLTLDDYLKRGLLAALFEVHARCGEAVHVTGYCLGGTLLAIAVAALARDGKTDLLRTVTLLAAQTDFSEPGELGLFIDASELAALDALMWQQGYLDGSQMAAAFQLLNARDLIWSRMMSEYLLGRRSKPNDLMAWNADTTRMPYRMHSEYLTKLFLNNDLAEGRYCVDGQPVALPDIDTPAFVVGTERDHVSPWPSVYKLHLFTHNALTFVLTSGGHNAGIVSEPGHPGRHYRCATREHDAPYRSGDEFFEQTPPVDGSWWPCWSHWLRDRSTGVVNARQPDPALDPAPGRYVLES